MSEKDLNLPASDEAVDAILAEVLGSAGSNMAKRYSGDGTSVPERKVAPEPAPQQPEQPPVAAPKNTVSAGSSQNYDMSPEMLNEDYRAAAARYDVNGYRISASQPVGYAPYAPYPAYPAYPVYPQPVAYAPYPTYPAYPTYPQPYGYPAYPTGYEAYAEYPAEQPQQASPEQNAGQNAYAAAAGSRVVYDADWAEGKPQAAQPAQPSVPVMQTANSGKPHVNPAFIDPLSSYDDDEEVPSPYTGSVSFADRHNARAPQQPAGKQQGTDFFPAGFSATKNNAGAANGKTANQNNAASDGEREKVFAGFSEDYEKTQYRSREWFMTDEQVQESREQRRREAEDAMQALEQELVEMPDTSRVVVTSDEAEDDEQRRRAEAQQIIAERFSQAAANEILYDSTEQFERDAQKAPQEESDYEDSSAYDYDYDYDYNEYENGGETELYYNSPDANNPEVNEQPAEKKKGNKFTAFIRRNTPHKGQTKREMLSCIIMDLAFLVLIGGLIFCGIYYKNYLDTRDEMPKIEDTIYEEGLADKMTDVELEQWWTDLKAAYPNIDYPDGMNPDFAKLYALNQDIAGWVKIEGADISTMVLQAEDNDYYLYRDFYKESTKYGIPFVDYRNNMSSPGLSRNTIIYGHNTHDGLLFYNLTRYLQLSGYRNAPVLSMNTLFNGMTYWKVFAVTLSDSTTDEFEYLYTQFTNENTFLSFIDDIRAHSMYDIPVDVVAGDNIITLYTCYQDLFKDGRLTIFARQVRAGEDLLVNTSDASVNSDCLYPDAYYGITYENSTSAITGTTSADSTTQAAASDAPADAADDEPVEGEAVTDPEYVPDENEGEEEYEPVETLAPEESLG